jgi:hypothetical protein
MSGWAGRGEVVKEEEVDANTSLYLDWMGRSAALLVPLMDMTDKLEGHCERSSEGSLEERCELDV